MFGDKHSTTCDRGGVCSYITSCIKHPIAQTSHSISCISEVLKKHILIPKMGPMFSGEEVPRTWLHTGLCGQVVGVCWIL